MSERADFYGVEVLFEIDGSRRAEHRGGYVPRAMLAAELSPWLALIRKRLKGQIAIAQSAEVSDNSLAVQ